MIAINAALINAFSDQTGSGVYATSGHTQSALYPAVLSRRAEWQSYQAIKLNFQNLM